MNPIQFVVLSCLLGLMFITSEHSKTINAERR